MGKKQKKSILKEMLGPFAIAAGMAYVMFPRPIPEYMKTKYKIIESEPAGIEKIIGQNFEDPLKNRPIGISVPNLFTDYKTEKETFSDDSKEILLARMIFGEARKRHEIEKIAVAHTALNRANDGIKWNGETVRDAILTPYQYTCFNKNNINRKKLMDPESYNPLEWDECLRVAKGVLNGEYSDPTGGATHYFNPRRANPKWKNKLEKIGRIKTGWIGKTKHEFYKE